MAEMSDAEVFGTAAPVNQKQEISDAEVFGGAPQKPQRSVIDQLLGIGGPRYQTFPERAVRDIAGIPRKSVEAAYSAPVGSREATAAMVGPAAEAAMVFSPVSKAGALFKGRLVKPTSPTEEELFKSSGASYKGARFMDLQIPAEQTEFLSSDIAGQLIKPSEITEKSFFPEDAPIVHKLVERLKIPHQGPNTTISDVESVRSALSGIASDPLRVGSERGAAFRAKDMIDAWVDELRPETVVSGDPETTVKLLKKARSDWAAMKRSERISEAEYRAEFGTSSTGKSANLVNKLKQGVNSILKSKKARRGYSDEEIKKMEELVKVTNPEQLLRIVSSFGPAHPITGWGPALAAFFAGDLGLAAGALGVGHVAQKASEALARRKMRQLGEFVRSRSALGQSRQPTIDRNYNWVDSTVTGPAIRQLLLQLGQSSSPGITIRDAQGGVYPPPKQNQ